jgi:hypothetical protein
MIPAEIRERPAYFLAGDSPNLIFDCLSEGGHDEGSFYLEDDATPRLMNERLCILTSSFLIITSLSPKAHSAGISGVGRSSLAFRGEIVHIDGMHKRTSKTQKDINAIATSIVEKTTGELIREKNPAAVALGRLGGLKGGKARASIMSAEKRREIAQKAARSRWGKK